MGVIKEINELKRRMKLGTLNSDLDQFNKDYSADYLANWHTADDINAYYDRLSALNDRTKAYQTYVNRYGTDEQKSALGDIGKQIASYDELIGKRQDVLDYYGIFADETAYSNALAYETEKAAKSKAEQDRIASLNVDLVKTSIANIDTSIANYEQKYRSAIAKPATTPQEQQSRASLMNSYQAMLDDLKATKSSLEADITAKELYDRNKMYTDILGSSEFASFVPVEDNNYDAVEKGKNPTAAISNVGHTTTGSGMSTADMAPYQSYGSGRYGEMEDEEYKLYKYLQKTYGQEVAAQYAYDLDNELISRYQENLKTYADEHPILGTIASFGTSALQGVDFLTGVAEKAITGNVRQGELTAATSALREGAVSDNPVDKFIYNTVVSGVDSAIAAYVGNVVGGVFGAVKTAGTVASKVASGVGSTMLGLSAASSTSNDILARGGTAEQAITGGIAAGFFEGFFESFSISQLQSMQPEEIVKNFKVYVSNVRKSVVTNASEEFATEVANIIFDSAYMGELSNVAMMLDQYRSQGLTEEEAKRKVAHNLGVQVLEAAASGALIGGGMTAIGGGVGLAKIDKARRKLGKSNISGGKTATLIEEATEAFKGEKYAEEQALIKKVEKGLAKGNKGISQQRNIGKLIEAYVEAKYKEQNREIAEQSVENIEKTKKTIENEATKVKVDNTNPTITNDNLPTIVGFKDAKLNETVIETEDGVTTFTEESAANADIGTLYACAIRLGNVQSANTFVQNWDGATDPFRYYLDFLKFQMRGTYAPESYDKTMTEYADVQMSPAAKHAAFQSGISLRESTKEKMAKQSEALKGEYEKLGGKAKKGKFNDSKLNYSALTQEQKDTVNFLRILSDYLGVNVEFFVSQKGRRGANGYYRAKTNTIYLDIYAGIGNKESYSAIKDCLINTMSHEIVHNMKITAPQEYEALRDFVIDKLKKQEGYDLDAKIEQIIAENSDQGFTVEDAIEEIVAMSCEDLLGSSEKLQATLTEFYAQNEKAANSFNRFVREVLARLKAFFEKIIGKKSVSAESQIMAKQSVEFISELQKRYDAALLAMKQGNAVRNTQNATEGEKVMNQARRDTDYLDAVNRGDMETAQRMVDEAAKEWGAITNGNTKKPRPLHLYHGTGSFGFTRFRDGRIYATAAESVASGYNRGQGLGRVRRSSLKYIPNDGTVETAIKNAKNVLGATLTKLDDVAKQNIISKADNILKDIANKVAELDETTDYGKATEFFEYLTEKYGEDKSLKWTNQLDQLHYMLASEYTAEEILADGKWLVHDLEKYHEWKQELSELWSEEREAIKDSTLDKVFRYLLGYEYGDALIDIEFGLGRLLDDRKKLVNPNGNLVYLDDIVDGIEMAKDTGIYDLYGHPGEKPLIIDEGKRFWDAIPFENGFRSTDYIAKWAKENGYTSVLFKTVLDPSSGGSANVYADEWVFFNSNQIKSADPVTYDDNGNVIPLSERFNEENEDIRYQRRKENADYSEYDKPITLEDIKILRSIGRKSINDFDADDLKKAQKWAYKFYKEQMLGTKSPFFRAWFGEWRAYDLNPAEIVSFAYGENRPLNKKTRNIYNKELRQNITIDGDVFEDSVHYATLNGDKKPILKLLGKIDEILAKGIPLDTRISNANKGNKKGSTQFMHYLYTPVSVNGAPFIAKLTVEEYDLTGQKRSYNLQKIEMSDLSRAQFSQIIENNREKYAYKSDSLSVSQLYDFVKTYDKKFSPAPEISPEDAKKLLNKDGTPKVFDYTMEDGSVIKVFKNGAGQIKSAETGIDANIGTFDGSTPDIFYQTRTENTTNRELLANALESTIDTSTEEGKDQLERLKDYKASVKRIGQLEKQRADLVDKGMELMRKKGKSAEENAELKSIWEKTKSLEKRISLHDKELLRIEALKPIQTLLYREKAKAAKKAKKQGLEKQKEIRENYTKREYIKKIEDRAKGLINAVKNVGDKHVPAPLREAIGNLVLSLDFSSKSKLAGKGDTQKDIKFSDAFIELAKLIEHHSPNTEDGESSALEEFFINCDITDEFRDQFTKIKDEVDKIARHYGSGNEALVLRSLSSEQLRQINSALYKLGKQISKANQLMENNLFKNVIEMSEEFIDFTEKFVQKQDVKWLEKLIDVDNLIPYYAFKRMGKVGMSLFNEWADGMDKYAKVAKEIVDTTNKLYTAKEIKEWNNTVHEIEIKGKKLYFTTAHLMSFYCLWKREAARSHISGYGIRVETFDVDKTAKKPLGKTYTNPTKGVHITDETAQILLDKLNKDKRAKEVADALQKFMSTRCAELANEITMKRFGEKAYTEEFYFPMDVNEHEKPEAGEINAESLYALPNKSFTKQLIPNSTSSLTIRNIFDVFAAHTTDVAAYHSLVIPLLDTLKFYNYKQKGYDAEGDADAITVRGQIEHAFGKPFLTYLKNFIKDTTGTSITSDRGSDGVGKWVSRYKIAAVAANLRVIVLQPTSYLRVSAVMKHRYLVKEIKDIPQLNEAVKRMNKYSGVALWKNELGFRDVNISRSLADKIKHADTIGDKVTDIAMKGAELADKVTWANIWLACEEEIKDTHKNIPVGKEAFYEKVSERFRDVIYSTQVVDSPLAKSNMARSKTFWNRTVTSFMSEPVVSHNLMLDAYHEVIDTKRRGEKVTWDNVRRVGRLVLAYTINATAQAVVSSLIDAARKIADDEDEEFADAYWSEFISNILQELDPLSKIPIIKDIIDVIRATFSNGYYSGQSMETAVFDRVTKAIKESIRYYSGESSTTKLVKRIMDAISSLSGIPISNAYREIKTIWNNLTNLFK